MNDDQIDALDTFALHAMAPRGRQSVRDFARAILAASEAAGPVATVHGVGWEQDDAEVRVFGVPARTWRRSFACTEPELEASALANKINAAAKLAPTDSQAGRDAVEAARYRWLRDVSTPPHNFYLSVPVEFDGVKYSRDEVDAAIDAALSTTTGRAAE
jgi:hypothetical protein